MGAVGTREGAGLAFLRSLGLNESACIEYPYGRFTTGYGRVRFGGRPRPAHVVSHELHIGPVPVGLEVCHNCGNRPCVNPAHLRADTHRANMGDCRIHGTHPRGERNGRSRLTTEQVAYVRERVGPGRTQAGIACELGVSLQTINHIVRGRTWAASDEIRIVAD